MGIYNNPHLFEKIISIKSFYDEKNEETVFMTISESKIKFWTLFFSKEKDCLLFKQKNTIK